MTLDGDLEKLRERSIGMALFSRVPGYETSSDPIVRMAASEIRKRLAQFYDESQDTVPVRILLPPGGYVAEFRFAAAEDIRSPLQPISARARSLPMARLPGNDDLAHDVTADRAVSVRVPLLTPLVIGLTATALIALVCAAIVYVQARRSDLPRFWRGAAEGGSGLVVLVLGQLAGIQTGPEDAAAVPLVDDVFRARHFVSLEAASSSLTLCSTLGRANLSCLLQPAPSLDLPAVRHKPAIFLGAYNNPWTLRVTGSLPYRFGPLACKCILDAKSSKPVAEVDFSAPRESILVDYSIVSRFHSDVTDGPVWVVAGLGPMSTVAAADFAASKVSSDELLLAAPKGWAGENVEAVLATDVVKGKPGHTHILRTSF